MSIFVFGTLSGFFSPSPPKSSYMGGLSLNFLNGCLPSRYLNCQLTLTDWCQGVGGRPGGPQTGWRTPGWKTEEEVPGCGAAWDDGVGLLNLYTQHCFGFCLFSGLNNHKAKKTPCVLLGRKKKSNLVTFSGLGLFPEMHYGSVEHFLFSLGGNFGL